MKNTGRYFGINVRLGKPRKFENGCVQRYGGFEPIHLVVIEPVPYILDFQI